MVTIKEILKSTYQLTFDVEVEYDWTLLAEVIVDSENVGEDLYVKQLVNNKESKEKLHYWQDLFFMEVTEQWNRLAGDDSVLFERIKKNPLFQESEKFLRQLPKVTTDLGRELIIDEMIANDNADELIPNKMLENALKKKSRDELRKEFESWNEEEEDVFRIASNPSYNYSEPSKTVINRKRETSKVLKYLIAASVVGIIALVGIKMLTNDNSFDKSSFATTTEKEVLRESGLGYVEEGSAYSMEVETINYEEAIAAGYIERNKVLPNSYSFIDGKLSLVFADEKLTIRLIELDSDKLYLNYDEKFYRIKTSGDYKKLERLNEEDTIRLLQRIIFDNE